MEFKTPEPLDLHSDNVAERWRKWKRQFEFYFEACELDKKTEKCQTAILLHAAGPEAQEIYHTFTYDEGETKDKYKTVLDKFDKYCEPLRNVVYERYLFWARDQMESETVDTWVAALRNMASKCEFDTQEQSMLRDKVVFGIRDISVKERLLRENGLTLKKALDLCRAAETSKQRIRAMTETEAHAAVNIHPVSIQNGRHFPNKRSEAPSSFQNKRSEAPSSFQNSFNCRFCGARHVKGRCAAYGKQCSKCSGYNHFAAVCKGGGYRRKHNQSTQNQRQTAPHQKPPWGRGKSVNVHVVGTEDSAANYLFVGPVTVNDHTHSLSQQWFENIVLNDTAVPFKLDTGADANCLPKALWHKLFPNQKLTEAEYTLKAYGGEHIKPAGVAAVNAKCPATGITLLTKFYVTDADVTPILGRTSCELFKLVQRMPRVKSMHQLNQGKALTTNMISDMYSDTFSGLGEYKQPYHITVDPSVPPVIQHNRKVPFAKLPALQTALQTLEQQGVIASVDCPTDWVHNLVITEKKNGNLRICLDPKPLNKAIKRERHSIPTVEDVLYRLNGKKLFTVVDMKDSYWHVKLDEPSSYLCTFHTPWGRKRFLRMPFGISSASEVMQKRNEQTFSDIPGVHVIADDIIIAADNETEHDTILLKVLERARQYNIKFNLDKLQFKRTEVTYMGHIVTSDGLRPCPKKIEAIVGMPCPTDRPALLRFLGMIKYLAQFIPGESTLTAPLRNLLKKDVPWQWYHEHDKAIESIKQALTEPVLLHFFDVSKPVLVQADASQSGLGACLLQDKRPVAFASRALTSAECNYSQIEKELLAICYACAKFHQYCYGRDVSVHTDHKPLEIIHKKPLGMAAPRLQRMLLQLQRYTLNVTYVPGKYMYVADTLSRAYLSDSTPIGAPEDIEVMVHSLTASLPISQQKLAMFQKATADDSVLQRLLVVVRGGWPKIYKSVHTTLRQFWNVRDEISEAEGLLFRGSCIIVPDKIRPEMLRLIHEGHLGIDKCRARARQIFYWPNMSQDIAQAINSCETCLTLRASQQKEPLLCHDIPQRPWQKLAADIMTLNGKDYLVVVDYFSKYPEIAQLELKTAKCVVVHLKSIFARHGVPEELVTDNMPFSSAEFREFVSDWDITLTTSSPMFPQSNGQAERAVQTVKRLLSKAQMSGQDPYIALLQYRLSPVAGTPYSPAQMLMGRQLRDKLPVPVKVLQPAIVKARPLLVERQLTHKFYYDKDAKPLAPLQPRDSVRVQRKGRWEPAVVIRAHKAPRSYIVSCRGHELRRNRRQLLSTPGVPPPHAQDSILDDYLLPEVTPAPDAEVTRSQPIETELVIQPQAGVNPEPQAQGRPKRSCQVPVRYKDDDYVMSKK